MAVEGAAKIIKVLLFVFNFIFFLGGIGLLGVGIYVQLKIGDYVALSSVKYVTGSIIIIAVGAIIAVIAFFGCCGSIKESRCLLGTFFALMLLVFGLEVAGTSLGFVYRDQVKDELKKDLNQTLYQYGSDDKKGVTEAYDLLQEKEKCCGVYGYKDWQKTPFTGGNHSIVPDSCCKEVKQGCGDISAGTENINIGGCYDKTLDLLRGNLLIIFGLGVAVAVIQVNWLYALFFFCEVTKNPNITAGKEDGNSKQSNGELVDEPCNTCLIDNSNDVSSSEGGWNIFSLTHVNAHNRVFV